MNKSRTISLIQASAILISSMIGVGVLDVPRMAATTADSGAPLITLIGIAVAFLALWFITILGMRFPRETIFQYSHHIIGRPLALFFNLCICLSFAIVTALTAREFGEVIVTTVLRDTPIEVTIIVLLVLTALSTRRNIVKFSYIHLFYLPFILGPALGIILTSLQNADVLNLEPVIGNHHTNIMEGLLDIAALFQCSFIITLIIPFMTKPEKAMKASIWAMIIAGMLYLLIVISTIATFGPHETIRLIWPTLENARTASIPGGFLERLDVIFLIVWLISVFTTMFTTYYLTSYATQELFHLKDHGLLSSFFLPFVFVISIWPHDIFQFYQIAQWTGRIGFFLTLSYPVLLWVIAVIQKKRGSTCEE